MLFTRSLWLRCSCAIVILGVLLLATHEQGIWDHVKLPIPLFRSRPKYQSTILRGISTGKGSKIVVMGKMTKDNTTWVQTELPDWQSAIYTVDDPQAPLHTTINKGREAMPYLTFIIENYDHLPETILFQHSHHNRAWHVSDNPGHDNAVTAQRLSLHLPYIQKVGYANLRCLHNPGCGGEVQPFRDPPILNYDKEGKLKQRVEMHVAETLRFMFGKDVEVPREIGVACCAQFVVSRKRVLERKRETYERIRQWVIETELNDYYSGRVMEYLWHIIFGMPAIHCPSMLACNCNLYGMCDVDDE